MLTATTRASPRCCRPRGRRRAAGRRLARHGDPGPCDRRCRSRSTTSVSHALRRRARRKRALVIADMPFGSYQASAEAAYAAAAAAMQAGAQMVKLEGGAWLAPTVEFLVARGIPVCGHVGLSRNRCNGSAAIGCRARPRTAADALVADARRSKTQARRCSSSNACRSDVGAALTQGRRRSRDRHRRRAGLLGQVLVIYDMLGIIAGRKPRFVSNFMAGAATASKARSRLTCAPSRTGRFPGPSTASSAAARIAHDARPPQLHRRSAWRSSTPPPSSPKRSAISGASPSCPRWATCTPATSRCAASRAQHGDCRRHEHLRQPAAVRAERGLRPLPAHVRGRSRPGCEREGVDVLFAPTSTRCIRRRRSTACSRRRSRRSSKARRARDSSTACARSC